MGKFVWGSNRAEGKGSIWELARSSDLLQRIMKVLLGLEHAQKLVLMRLGLDSMVQLWSAQCDSPESLRPFTKYSSVQLRIGGYLRVVTPGGILAKLQCMSPTGEHFGDQMILP